MPETMKTNDREAQSGAGSRREFLISSGRYLGFGALASLVAMQEVKRRRLEGDPNCIRIVTCGDCIEFQGCEKTKARQARVGKVTIL
jgi:hypothetical protein